jgi:hypothetical protein
MTPCIPQELSDVIIDYLHDDRPALGRCGLVCWSWLPSSRFHLFSTIKLFHYDMNTDLTILCAHDSTIMPYVKNLSVFHVQWHSLTLEAKDRLLSLSYEGSYRTKIMTWTWFLEKVYDLATERKILQDCVISCKCWSRCAPAHQSCLCSYCKNSCYSGTASRSRAILSILAILWVWAILRHLPYLANTINKLIMISY